MQMGSLRTQENLYHPLHAPAKDDASASASGATKVESNSELDIKTNLRAGLFLTDTLTMEQLEVGGWRDLMCDAARLADMKQLASTNGVSQNGNKIQILLRIIDNFKS